MGRRGAIGADGEVQIKVRRTPRQSGLRLSVCVSYVLCLFWK